MSPPKIALGIILGVKAIFVTATLALNAYLGYREPITLICPKTGREVTVRVDSRYAAATSAIGHARYRLLACSRWPENAGCGRDCMSQL
jgi:hypothetical protein